MNMALTCETENVIRADADEINVKVIDSKVQLTTNMLVSMVTMLFIFLPLGIRDVLF